MNKPLEKWSFDELVDYCSGEILKSLLAGQFRAEVHCCLGFAIRWERAVKKKGRKK